MFVFLASFVDVDELGAGGFELGERLGYDDFGSESAFDEILIEVELVLVVGYGALEEAGVGVEAAEFEVVKRELSVENEVEVSEVGGTSLSALVCGFDIAADATPEVGLPAGSAFELEVAVLGGVSRLHERPVAGNTITAGSRRDGERGIEIGARDADLVACGEIGFKGGAEVLVLRHDLFFEGVELWVLVDLPPFAAKHAVGGRCGFPCASGWVGWRNDRSGGAAFLVGRGWRSRELRALVVGANFTSGEERCDEEQRR